ncbi:MAG: hypothetical protein INH41_23235 [Myxococcaceae bacterium]|nr:hypothetical protein [Myxococcaceae bacterium]
MRDPSDLGETPAPDVTHGLSEHVPFLTGRSSADSCQTPGAFACRTLDAPERLRRLERFCWFTIKVGLVEPPRGPRVFGAGVASSTSECVYARSDPPEVVSFDDEHICARPCRIDQLQRRLFRLPTNETLGGPFDALSRGGEAWLAPQRGETHGGSTSRGPRDLGRHAALKRPAPHLRTRAR